VTGWQLIVATGVSADGSVISGQGIDPSGRNQGWIAKLPLSAAAQMTNLIRMKESFNLPKGIENSLDAKLSNAQSSLAANNITAACNQMGAFIQETSAQSGKMLTVDQANQLNLAANQIRATLKCGSM
jgi:hypothetical protein